MGKVPLNPNDRYSLPGLVDYLYYLISTISPTVTHPSITTTALSNCASITYSNSTLVQSGSFSSLTFNLIITPVLTSTETLLEITSLPNKTNVFASSYDAVFSGIGQTAIGGSNVAIENIYFTTSGLNAIMSFTSSSTNPHYISVTINYTD